MEPLCWPTCPHPSSESETTAYSCCNPKGRCPSLGGSLSVTSGLCAIPLHSRPSDLNLQAWRLSPAEQDNRNLGGPNSDVLGRHLDPCGPQRRLLRAWSHSNLLETGRLPAVTFFGSLFQIQKFQSIPDSFHCCPVRSLNQDHFFIDIWSLGCILPCGHLCRGAGAHKLGTQGFPDWWRMRSFQITFQNTIVLSSTAIMVNSHSTGGNCSAAICIRQNLYIHIRYLGLFRKV